MPSNHVSTCELSKRPSFFRVSRSPRPKLTTVTHAINALRFDRKVAPPFCFRRAVYSPVLLVSGAPRRAQSSCASPSSSPYFLSSACKSPRNTTPGTLAMELLGRPPGPRARPPRSAGTITRASAGGAATSGHVRPRPPYALDTHPSHRRTLKLTPCLVRSSPSCARFFTNLLHPPGTLSFAPHSRLPRSRHQMSTSAPTTCTAPARDVPPGVRGTRDARRVATRAIRTRSGSTQTRGSAPAAPLGIDC